MSSPCRKFEDCASCLNRREPETCADCEAGEQYEPRENGELSFDELSFFPGSSENGR